MFCGLEGKLYPTSVIPNYLIHLLKSDSYHSPACEKKSRACDIQCEKLIDEAVKVLVIGMPAGSSSRAKGTGVSRTGPDE